MGLIYKRSTEKAARSYERSRGMEPNPGVSALTVVNPRKKRVRNNPFQWIQGKGQRHRHMSPAYKTVSGASNWKGRSKSPARLYPVDEHGTIVSRSVSKKLLTTNRRNGQMAYNIGALRRAMRSNMSDADRKAVRQAARAIDLGKSPSRRRRKSSKSRRGSGGAFVGLAAARHGRKRSRAHARASAIQKSTGGRRRRRKAAVVVIPGRGGVAVSGPGRRRRRSKSKSRSKRSRRSSARRAAPSRRRRSARRSSKRRSSKRSSKRRARRSSKRRSSKRRSSKRKTRRGGKRRARATRRGGRRRSRGTGYRYGSRRVRLTGREYIDKYLSHGLMPTVARVRRTSASRSGRSPILSYPISGGIGRLSKRKTSRRARGKRSYAIGATHHGRRKRRMAANRRRSRRSRRSAPNRRRSRRSRRNSRRRRSRRNVHYALMKNGRRRSRRNSRRRRSRRRMTRNMLAASKVRWHGRGSHRAGRASGRLYQMVEYGSKSKSRKGRRMTGYPVLVPAHVSERAYVRKYRFGGAARDAHSRALSRGYRERKRYPKRRITKNRRRSSMRRNKYVVANRRRRSRRNSRRRSRRNTTYYAAANPRRRRRRSRRNTRYATANRRRSRRSRRNIMYAAANRRRSRRNSRRSRRSRRNTGVRAAAANGRRRRLRRNMFFGADIVNDVAIPVIAGTGGFVAARVISNGLANIESIRNILDAGKPAAEATNTKIVANLLGILATLGLGTQVSIIKRHQGALVTGMGLALTDRLLSKVTGDAAAYLSGVGEYVSSPMNGFGEYVNQPLSGMGAYVSDPAMGEYVNQPLSGMGETLYAAAGLGRYQEGIDPANQATVDGLMDVMEAAAGTGGLGEEADASLARMWGKRQIGFESIETPTDVARVATQNMPFTREVPESLVTPEGRGFAGGLFARNLFSGMMGG